MEPPPNMGGGYPSTYLETVGAEKFFGSVEDQKPDTSTKILGNP